MATSTEPCMGCAMEQGSISDQHQVLKTKHFSLHQDYEVPIPGFLILSSRRHFKSITDFTKTEQDEFMQILMKARHAMREALNVTDVYLFQNEDTKHHFHIWMFPRLPWMEQFGRKIESVRPIMKHAQQHLKTKENLVEVKQAAEKLRRYIEKS